MTHIIRLRGAAPAMLASAVPIPAEAQDGAATGVAVTAPRAYAKPDNTDTDTVGKRHMGFHHDLLLDLRARIDRTLPDTLAIAVDDSDRSVLFPPSPQRRFGSEGTARP